MQQENKQTIFIVIEGGVLQYTSTNITDTNIVLIDRDQDNGEIVVLTKPDSIYNDITKELETLTDKTEILTTIKNIAIENN